MLVRTVCIKIVHSSLRAEIFTYIYAGGGGERGTNMARCVCVCVQERSARDCKMKCTFYGAQEVRVALHELQKFSNDMAL